MRIYKLRVFACLSFCLSFCSVWRGKPVSADPQRWGWNRVGVNVSRQRVLELKAGKLWIPRIFKMKLLCQLCQGRNTQAGMCRTLVKREMSDSNVKQQWVAALRNDEDFRESVKQMNSKGKKRKTHLLFYIYIYILFLIVLNCHSLLLKVPACTVQNMDIRLMAVSKLSVSLC